MFFLFATTFRPSELNQRLLPPEVKRLGHVAGHSLPSSAEVKHAQSCTSSRSYVFMVWCLVQYRRILLFLYIS